MSKAILIMDMPKNCSKCDLSDDCSGICNALLLQGEQTKLTPEGEQRPEWCPLKNIGDLNYMNKAYEKILERLEKKKQYYQNFYDTDGNTEEDENINKATQLAFDDAKRIVQEVAEEQNGGWIPCSERLPDADDLHKHNIEDSTSYLIQRRCGVMDVAHYIKIYGEPYFEANSIKIKDVVAWQPLPESYKERESE